QSLQAFKSNQHICLPFLHDGFCHMISIAHKCYHTSSPLCHSMHFREFHIITGCGGQLSKNAAGEERSLSADSDYHNIFSVHMIPLFFPALSISSFHFFNCVEFAKLHA